MKDVNFLSFPGLGIDEFRMEKAAFSIFGHEIMWYGIILTLGIVAAGLYALYRANKNEGIKTDDVLDYAIWLVICGIAGARLYYVFTSFDQYKGDGFFDTLKNIVAVWEGGIAIYGAIIAGAITLAIVSFVKKIKLGKAFDMVAPAVMLGQIIGRWGNFCNAEAHGGETSLPWRMGIRPEGSEETTYVHPTFLYESLWNLVGFLLINLFYKKKKYDGQILFMYITWYGFGRMLIEGLRTDSLYVGDFRISQVVGFLCFFFGAAILVAMEIVIRLRRRDVGAEPAAVATAAESTVETTATAIVGATDDTAVEAIEKETDESVKETAETSSDGSAEAPAAASAAGGEAADTPASEPSEEPTARETDAPALEPAPNFDIASLYGDDEEEEEA
jgi:phosphatidylglycerol:prolipoprotein diacylglycerol transferase